VTGLRDPYNLLFRNLKQSEEALRKSEARYRGLSESLEETVKEKVAELRQAQRLAALGQMVSFVAHEIRNPLQNIRFGVDEIRKEIGEDETKLEILEDIESGVEMLNGTVRELLEYSRPVNLEYTLWPISDIVGQALDAAGHKLRNITTRLELESGDRKIYIDAHKIARVLVNLISNAAEAMPNGGNLTICSQFSQSEGVLKLCVSDSGCGIDAENLERVQEPFFTTKAQGTGLGVPICKKIVEAHSGSLTITSKVNEGTTVEIMLPAGTP
jgi:signal transduction histidine kinase